MCIEASTFFYSVCSLEKECAQLYKVFTVNEQFTGSHMAVKLKVKGTSAEYK